MRIVGVRMITFPHRWVDCSGMEDREVADFAYRRAHRDVEAQRKHDWYMANRARLIQKAVERKQKLRAA